MTRDTVTYSDFGEELGSKESKESNTLTHNNNSIPGTSDAMNLRKQGIIGKTQQELSTLEVTPYDNDNGLWDATDNGKTFGMAVEYKDKDWTIGGKMYAYTDIRGYNPEKREFKGTRTDTAELYVLKNITEVQTKVGNIVGYVGGGAQGIGDFGGSKIQNAWHKHGPRRIVGPYTHQQSQESISGWTPDVRARIEGSTGPLVGTDTHNIILKGSLDVKVPVIKKYGETSVTLAASLEAKMDRFTAEVGVRSALYRDLPLSDTIRAAQNNPRNAIVVGVSADVWKTANTTTTVVAEFERAISNSPSYYKNRGSLGVKVSF